jgi:hypothetical protein
MGFSLFLSLSQSVHFLSNFRMRKKKVEEKLEIVLPHWIGHRSGYFRIGT